MQKVYLCLVDSILLLHILHNRMAELLQLLFV